MSPFFSYYECFCWTSRILSFGQITCSNESLTNNSSTTPCYSSCDPLTEMSMRAALSIIIFQPWSFYHCSYLVVGCSSTHIVESHRLIPCAPLLASQARLWNTLEYNIICPNVVNRCEELLTNPIPLDTMIWYDEIIPLVNLCLHPNKTCAYIQTKTFPWPNVGFWLIWSIQIIVAWNASHTPIKTDQFWRSWKRMNRGKIHQNSFKTGYHWYRSINTVIADGTMNPNASGDGLRDLAPLKVMTYNLWVNIDEKEQAQ